MQTATISTTISNGQSLSPAVDLSQFINVGGPSLFGIVMPSEWDAAALTVLASFDNGSTHIPMGSLYDGTEITYAVNVSGYFPLPNPQIFAAVTNIKIQSGTSAYPINQTADRTIQLVLRSI